MTIADVITKMHYYDKKHIKASKLVVMIYKHTAKDKEDGCELELASIQDCKLIHPNQLSSFFILYRYLLGGHFKDLPEESWYKLSLRFNSWDNSDFEILDTESQLTERMKLH